MKVLFLDIDGVLNTPETWDVTKDEQKRYTPECVEQLNRVARETGCVAVLSSSWRNLYTLKQIREFFYVWGCEIDLIDKTPAVVGPMSSNANERGMQINKWIVDTSLKNIESFAVVDDNFVDSVVTTFVQTDYRKGLTKEDADTLIEFLGKNPEKDIYERIVLAFANWADTDREHWSEQFYQDREFIKKRYSELKSEDRGDGFRNSFSEANFKSKVEFLKMVLKDKLK